MTGADLTRVEVARTRFKRFVHVETAALERGDRVLTVYTMHGHPKVQRGVPITVRGDQIIASRGDN